MNNSSRADGAMSADVTIFLSYARPDSLAATRLFHELTELGWSVWFDRVSLKPGQQWKQEIRGAIKESRYYLALLSRNSLSRKGFVQAELATALEVLRAHPSEDIFIIPVRLEECQPRNELLREIHWVDLFPSWEDGLRRIQETLSRSSGVGLPKSTDSMASAPPRSVSVKSESRRQRPLTPLVDLAFNGIAALFLILTLHVGFEAQKEGLIDSSVTGDFLKFIGYAVVGLALVSVVAIAVVAIKRQDKD